MSPAASARPLDIELTVEAFLTRAKTDAGAAAGAWKAATGTSLPQITEALWRMLGARMTPDVASCLVRSLDGVKIAAELALRQMVRPTIPLLPFAVPHQEHDFYRSVALRYGTPAVRDALRLGRLVLVALRKSSSTLAGTGKGSYDDRIAVLQGVGPSRRASVFPACTEPGAQYSQRSALGAGRTPVDPRYAHVGHRKADGVDINKDGIKDAGRLVEGTYRYYEKSGGFLGDRAFQVKVGQVVERDTDGDGLFTINDPDRLDTKRAGTSMYIHRGGADTVLEPNTWSAGCQTIPKNHYKSFLSRVGGAPASFHYVLVNTA